MDYMLKMFKKKTNADASKDKKALQKLRREVRSHSTLSFMRTFKLMSRTFGHFFGFPS